MTPWIRAAITELGERLDQADVSLPTQSEMMELFRRHMPMRQAVKKISAKKRTADKGYGELRKKVAGRANCHCERCGKWTFLPVGHLHHKTYRSHGGKHTMANSEWLCSECHREEHDGGKPCPRPDGTR